jgi:hypothetical protein
MEVSTLPAASNDATTLSEADEVRQHAVLGTSNLVMDFPPLKLPLDSLTS